MTKPARGKVILFSAALFIAGGVCGVMVLRHFSPPVAQSLKVGRSDEITTLITEKMKAKLTLTPDQLDKLRPAIKRTAEALEASHLDCLKRTSEAVDRLIAEAALLLTAEQKEKMKLMEAERRDTLLTKYNYQLEATNSRPR